MSDAVFDIPNTISTVWHHHACIASAGRSGIHGPELTGGAAEFVAGTEGIAAGVGRARVRRVQVAIARIQLEIQQFVVGGGALINGEPGLIQEVILIDLLSA